MGTLRGDNGGERPPDGGGLPGLPPEWGTIVVPDDAAALNHEAHQVRKQLRRRARRNWWRRRFGLPPITHKSPEDDAPALGLPLLIMSIAIIATLTSLFAIAWPSRAVQTSTLPRGGATSSAAALPAVPDLTLTEPNGISLRLRTVLPAVVLLVDGCTCATLITGTAQAVDTRVTVLVVARSEPTLPSPLPVDKTVYAAADTAGLLWTRYGQGTHIGVLALLVKATGQPVVALSDVQSVNAFRPYLNQLI